MKPQRFGCIYKITNLLNGKCYVGQTIRKPEARWGAHRSIGPKPSVIQNAFLKHGVENFSFEVIASANSRENLNYLEDLLIGAHNALGPHGYTCLGSRGCTSSVSDKTRQKMSAAKKGRPALNKGVKMSKETCAKMSAAKKGKKPSNTGKPHSAESKARMSAARMGFKPTPESTAKAVATKKANGSNKHTDATKAKLSAAKMGFRLPQEIIDRVSENKRKFIYIATNLKDSSDERVFKTIADMRAAGFDYTVVSKVCSGSQNRKSHKGYSWKKLRKS